MINKFILPLLAVLLFGSCANKFSLVKRKYNKGYHFSMAKKQSKHDVPAKDAEKVATLQPKENVLPKNEVTELSPSAFEVMPIIKNEVSTNKTSHKKTTVLAAKTKEPFKEEKEIRSLSAPQIVALKKEIEKSSKGGGDVNTILLVILAILIPPLGVYLRDKATDKWFWITLVLWVLSFTALIFVFGGLLWLAAAIIAVLYVLHAL